MGAQPYREWLKASAVKLDLSINQDADLPDGRASC